MKKAIVTLVIGERYVTFFQKFCRQTWTAYAQKYDYDLIVLDQSLDNSPRAKSRSPSWQKCLILSHPQVQQYEQVVWVDADILINPTSPDICATVPVDKIGAVDAYAIPNKEEHDIMLARQYEAWSRKGVQFIHNLTPSEYHEQFGLDPGAQGVVHCGVLVLSPHHHTELLTHVYDAYEDKGGAAWNYEMRPLSYEIQKHHFEYWINSKFNMSWPKLLQYHYPFLAPPRPSLPERVARKFGFRFTFIRNRALLGKCATTAYRNNYFLHFAGTTNHMQYVDTNADYSFGM